MSAAVTDPAVIVLVGLALTVGLCVVLMVLRPSWTWFAVLAGALITGDRLGFAPWAVAVAVAGVWLLVRGVRMVTKT